MQKTIIASYLVEELEQANRIYGTSFNSPHEGFAVIQEELCELWAEVRQKHPDENRMREEAIQLGAMAMKFISSMDKWFPRQRTESLKCCLCLYNVTTDMERSALGGDPCLTCDNWSNWEAKLFCDDCGKEVVLGEDYFLEAGTDGIPEGERSKMVC